MEGTDDEPLGRPSFQQNSAECESEPLFARLFKCMAGTLHRCILGGRFHGPSSFTVSLSLQFHWNTLFLTHPFHSHQIFAGCLVLYSLSGDSVLAWQVHGSSGPSMVRIWIFTISVLLENLPRPRVFYCGLRSGYIFVKQFHCLFIPLGGSKRPTGTSNDGEWRERISTLCTTTSGI